MSKYKLGKQVFENVPPTLSIKGIQMFVFDMAGTCVDENGLVYKIMNKTLEEYNIQLDDIREIGGFSKIQVIRNQVDYDFKIKREAIRGVNRTKYLKGLSEDTVDEEIKQFVTNQIYRKFQKNLLESYNIRGNLDTYPGVYNLFHNLRERDITVCLNTGYPEHIATTIINKLGFKGLINGYIASDMVEKGRPEPYMINKLMSDNNITDSKNVIKVGDTVVDMLEGTNANVRYNVGVLTGVNNRDELWRSGADLVLPSVNDINKLLL